MEPEKCRLFREGITEAPAEWSRRTRGDEELSSKDEQMEVMFGVMQASLAYGSVALLRVNPSKHFGQDMVPVFIGRKAPSDFSSRSSRDGMFVSKDTMVWIHDIVQVPGRVQEYDVPDEPYGRETRAVPLRCIAGLGQSLEGYMKRVPAASSSPSTTRYRMRIGVVEDARSNLVLMSTNPRNAYSGFSPVAMSSADFSRAPVNQSLFKVGETFRKGFRAPPQGRRTAWRGLKTFTARVEIIITCPRERRHKYRVKWEASEGEKAFACIPRDVDEGYIEQCLP